MNIPQVSSLFFPHFAFLWIYKVKKHPCIKWKKIKIDKSILRDNIHYFTINCDVCCQLLVDYLCQGKKVASMYLFVKISH